MNGAADHARRDAGRLGVHALRAPGKHRFVHALDMANRRAFCVDLPWKSPKWIYEVRLRVRGGTLELRRHGETIARMDRKTLKVTT